MAEVVVPKVVEAVVTSATNEAVDSVWRQIGYIWNYNTNILDLQQQLDKLKAKKQSMQHSVDEARWNGEVIEDSVTIWLNSADEAIQAAEKTLQENSVANKSCFRGCFPNLKTRHKFSRKAKKENTPALVQVQEEGRLIGNICYRPYVQDLEPVTNYEGLESRMEVLKEIVGALKSSDVNRIGVYGLGGVGKSTLVKQQVVAQVKKEGIFKVVAIANVNHPRDLRKIQQEIAEWLAFKFDIYSTELRAAQLRRRLEQEKKVLVILDDLWEMIALEEIGIPNMDDHKGCKVLMTSRDLNVLLKIGVQRHFLLQVLNETEAWQLFEKKVGELNNLEIQSTARKVSERCAGLPVLIVAVATSLRDKEVFEWNDALEHVQKFVDKGIDAPVYSVLELSYNFLGDDAKALLVLCRQGRVAIHLIDLVKYATGLGLFQSCSTIKAVRNRVLKLVNDLKKLCFLLEDNHSDFVRMHDVVYSFVASMASKQHHFIACESELEEWPGEDKFERYTAITVRNCKIPNLLPQVLECPKLESLIYGVKDPLLKIPQDFFSRTKKLKLVDLTEVNLRPILPLSLGFLENLQTLCLDYCDLEDISAIGDLKKLQVLSLIGSNIVQLPMEIRNLTHLQFLDLSGCQRLEVIPPGVLNCLKKLEELCMWDSIVRWEDEGNASLSELKSLCNLINLEIFIKDTKVITVDLVLDKLERFRILIGNHRDSNFIDETSGAILKLKSINDHCIEFCPFKRMTSLIVHGCGNLVYVFTFSMVSSLAQLKKIEICDCESMEEVISTQEEIKEEIVFPNLNYLLLRLLPKVVKFCTSNLLRCISLKELSIKECPRLQTFVSTSHVGASDEAHQQHSALFDAKVELPNLEKLSIYRGSGLKVIWDDELHHNSFLKLKSLSVIWSKEVVKIFPSDLRVKRFQNLEELMIEGCDGLTEVFPASVARGLVHLQSLVIRDSGIKEIIVKDDEEGAAVFEFPKLNSSILWELPELERFYPETNTSQWPALQKFCISGCNKFQLFTLLHEKNIPNLEELTLGGTEIKRIHETHLPMKLFHKLKVVELNYPFDRSNSSHFGVLQIFENVETLSVLYGQFEELFPGEGLVVDEEGLLIPTRLHSLELRSLSNLKAIWNRVLQTLEKLSVRDCKSLIIVAPSSASFYSLTSLDIKYCGGLMSLVTSSTAKTLIQLKTLSVSHCNQLKVIVSDEEDEVMDEINFMNLETLELRNLPSLSNFCSINHRFKFPCLTRVVVKQCPMMEFFSKGISVTPMLRTVQEPIGFYGEKYKEHWLRDLNSTMSFMYKSQLNLLENPSSPERLTAQP